MDFHFVEHRHLNHKAIRGNTYIMRPLKKAFPLGQDTERRASLPAEGREARISWA
jgi:hypothetical protein